MKKLVKEELRPAYYPDDSEWRHKHEPWTQTPETNQIMEDMLDKFEKVNSLDETDYDTVFLIKWALWIGYNHKKTEKSTWQETPRGPRGDMDPESWGDPPDWRPREMGQ